MALHASLAADVAALIAGILITLLVVAMMSAPRRAGRHVRVDLADAYDVLDDEGWADEPGPEDVPGDEEPVEEPAGPEPFDPLTSPIPEAVLAELRLLPAWTPQPLPEDVMRSGVTGQLPRLDDAALAELDAARAAA
jgi:hypothetical protein